VGNWAVVDKHINDDVAGCVDAHGTFMGSWSVTEAEGANREGQVMWEARWVIFEDSRGHRVHL
jgi:hypothetical protein